MECRSDFASTCSALRRWLAAAPSLDPALAAAADVLNRAGRIDLAALRADSADAHALLGAVTLEALLDLSRSPYLEAR